MRMALGAAVVAAACLLVAGCTSSSNDAHPAPSGGPTTLPAGTSGLRGVPVDRVKCSDNDHDPVPPATTIVENPSLLVVCPMPAWDPAGPAMASGVQLPAGMPQFERMVEALSAADEVSSTNDNVACPMYADVPMYVYAEADGGNYRLAIPVDVCGHYQAQARDAVALLTTAVR